MLNMCVKIVWTSFWNNSSLSPLVIWEGLIQCLKLEFLLCFGGFQSNLWCPIGYPRSLLLNDSKSEVCNPGYAICNPMPHYSDLHRGGCEENELPQLLSEDICSYSHASGTIQQLLLTKPPMPLNVYNEQCLWDGKKLAQVSSIIFASCL